MIFFQIFLSNLGFNSINIIKDNLFLEVNSPLKVMNNIIQYSALFHTLYLLEFIRNHWFPSLI